MVKKLKYISIRKAGIQIDFAFSILIFLIIFLVFYEFYHSEYINQKNYFVSLNLDAMSRDICKELVSSSGEPLNWEESLSTATFPALKSVRNNSLNQTKLLKFTDSNYWTIVKLYGLNSYNLNIDIVGTSTNTTYLNFGANISDKNVEFSNYFCFSNYNNEIVRVLVGVWI